MSNLVVGDYQREAARVMDVDAMRAITRELVERVLVTSTRNDLGERVELTPDELLRTDVVEREGERAVGLRPAYELSYREAKFDQASALKGTTDQFRFHVHALLEHTRKELVGFQPDLDWRLVACVVDPVDITRTTQSFADQRERDQGLVLANLVRNLDPERGDRVHRENASAKITHTRHFRWYLRMVWADIAGGGYFRDPAAASGGTSGYARYAESRQLRHLPPGARRNREEARKLLERVGLAAAIAPAPDAGPRPLTREQLDTARELLATGANVLLVARALGVAPALVERLLEDDRPKRGGPRARTLPGSNGPVVDVRSAIQPNETPSGE